MTWRFIMPTPCQHRLQKKALCPCFRADFVDNRLRCHDCNADRGPLRQQTFDFIAAVERQFGPLTDPILLTKPRFQPASTEALELLRAL